MRNVGVRFESELADGTRILFRPIEPDDKDMLRRGFTELSPTSRYRRFFRNIDHLSERALRYLTEVDGRDHVAWVAIVDEPDGPHGVGVGRWIRLRDDLRAAEAAITVVDAFHGRGIERRCCSCSLAKRSHAMCAPSRRG